MHSTGEIPYGEPFDLSEHVVGLEKGSGRARMMPPGRGGPPRIDGYTVGAPFMTKTAYDPATDFTYVIGISGLTAGLVVRADAPWKTFGDFLADAKARRDDLKSKTK